jgi:predicted TIM-barrel fold metal-dependent hydrolase
MTALESELPRTEALLRARRIAGLKLYPGYQHIYPSDRSLYPAYEMCRASGVPVLFHTGDTLNNYEIRGKVRYAHPLHIDDVAVDFPGLRIIICHAGNPWLVDCAEVLYKNADVYADISGLVVGEGLESPYGALMRQRIRELADYASAEKLLFGTDWPLARLDDYIRFTEGLGFPQQVMERIFSGNAVELFKLDL